MDIRPIKTEDDYRATLREIETLMRATPGSPEGERLDILVTLVGAYEQRSSRGSSGGTLLMRPYRRPSGLLTDKSLPEPGLGVVAKGDTYGRLPTRDLTQKRSGRVPKWRGLIRQLRPD